MLNYWLTVTGRGGEREREEREREVIEMADNTTCAHQGSRINIVIVASFS